VALLRIRLEQHGRVLTDLDGLLNSIKQAVNAELYGGALFLQGRVQRATPVGVTAALRRGWFVDYGPGENQVTLGNPSEYLLATELGRRAAPVPIAPLELWVRRKLGIPRPQSFSVAKAISWKKAHSRTPGKFFVKRAVDQAIPALERVLLRRVGLALQAQWEQTSQSSEEI
jgi:hypothetical protein